jgi:hypothetical protein
MEAKMDALISLLKMLILVLFVVRIVVIMYVLKEELEKKYKIKINYRLAGIVDRGLRISFLVSGTIHLIDYLDSKEIELPR